jgi:uncharacterized SAM-binding protein YcdF (DUF218 family)
MGMSEYQMLKEMFTPGIRIFWMILTALCLLYAVMVYLVGSGTFSFVIWIAGAVFFEICFVLSGKGRWAAVPAAARCVTYGVLAVIATVFVICQIAILSHFYDKGEKNLDYVIVLGAQMRSSGPSVIYQYRLEKTREYLEDNPQTKCVTTGAQGNNEPMSEGQGGADYLVNLGIPEDRIEVESLSMDTEENIMNAIEIIERNEESTENLRIGIITNGFHVFRGVHIAKKQTDAEVCGIAAYMQPQYIPNNMVRETFGILRDFFAGRLKL